MVPPLLFRTTSRTSCRTLTKLGFVHGDSSSMAFTASDTSLSVSLSATVRRTRFDSS